jgi:dTDP-4-amino-4,6-dideoxygalactose transaminase
MWRIPLSDLNYGPEEEAAVLEVLRSRWLSMGPKTEEFESAAAEYLGVKHAIAVTNCTCALELAYEYLLNVRGESGRIPNARKPMVVVPDITFVATSNAAIYAGARPTFCDITNLNMPTARLAHARALLDAAGDSAAAVALVHYAGFDAGAEQFAELCRSHNVTLLEDAAHAIGSTTATGAALGTIGSIGCYSFFSNKNLATGEGGLLVTNDEDTAIGLRLLRSHGMTSLTYQRHRTRTHGYDVLSVGHNYRCTELMAALAIEQLKKLDAGNARRRELFRLYRSTFAGETRLLVPFAGDDEAIDRSACHIFSLLCSSPGLRDRVRDSHNAAGIQTSHHYPPVHTFPYYHQTVGAGIRIPSLHELGEGFPPGWASGRSEFPLAASVHYAARQITLPLHPGLTDADVEEITATILRTVAHS